MRKAKFKKFGLVGEITKGDGVGFKHERVKEQFTDATIIQHVVIKMRKRLFDIFQSPVLLDELRTCRIPPWANSYCSRSRT